MKRLIAVLSSTIRAFLTACSDPVVRVSRPMEDNGVNSTCFALARSRSGATKLASPPPVAYFLGESRRESAGVRFCQISGLEAVTHIGASGDP